MAIQGVEKLFPDNAKSGDAATIMAVISAAKSTRRDVKQLNASSSVQPTSDPYSVMSQQSSQAASTRQPVFAVGRVIQSLPGVNWYRLGLEPGRGEIAAYAMDHDSGGVFGPQAVRTFAPGTMVLVMQFNAEEVGIIIGTLPPLTEEASIGFGDRISVGSNVGLDREAHLYTPLLQFADEDMGDRGANEPVDSTGAEFGRFGLLGTGVFIDMFMAYLRANELAGIWFNVLGNHGRLAAHNYDFRSSVEEQIHRNDRGELQFFRGIAARWYEKLGAVSPGQTAFKSHTAAEMKYELPVGQQEPIHADQTPFYRLSEYAGYLGQLWLRDVVAPKVFSGLNRLSSPLPRQTLFREQLAANGHYSLLSATGFTLMRRFAIPTVLRKREADDPQGDTVDNYKAAGDDGSGEPHDQRTTIPAANGTAATALPDKLAHMANWQQVRAAIQHAADFEVQQERSANIYDFSSLASEFELPSPEPVTELAINPDAEPEKLYKGFSGLDVAEDGTVTIVGPAGQMLRMTPTGGFELSGPQDLAVTTGRSVVIHAGKDAVVKAHGSIDLSTATKDVRIKSEGSFELLAAASGRGRFLIDHRGVGETDFKGKHGEDITGGGFVIKSSKSPLRLFGAGVYVRSGGGDITPGPIIIDADKGRQQFQVISQSIDAFVTGSVNFTFPAEEDSKKQSYSFSPRFCAIPARTTFFDGSILTAETRGFAIFGASVAIANGHVSSELSDRFRGLVGALNEKQNSLQKTKDSIRIFSQVVKLQLQSATERFENVSKTLYENSEKPGDDEFIRDYGFSFRTPEQYGTANGFRMPVPYWRTLTNSSRTWDEKAVTHQQEKHAPYPGYKPWFESSSLKSTPLSLYNPNTGLESQDNDSYRDYRVAAETSEVPQNNFPII